MYAEVKDGTIRQVVEDTAPVTTVDGAQYPGTWAKTEIPGLIRIVDPGRPDPERYLVVGQDVALIDGIPTLTYTVEPILTPAPSPEEIKAERINLLLRQIAALEARQPRALREYTLADSVIEKEECLSRLRLIDSEIENMREKLHA